jgi:hypothetical protein
MCLLFDQPCSFKGASKLQEGKLMFVATLNGSPLAASFKELSLA